MAADALEAMNPLRRFEIPGRVAAFTGAGVLPALRVESDHSVAEIYQHGACVTSFRRHGEEPLLFLSRSSRFDSESPIRGGVPIVFPWFGARGSLPQHGYARTTPWEVVAVTLVDDGAVAVELALPRLGGSLVTLEVTVGASLKLALRVENSSIDQQLTFESCLHPYFHVGAIERVTIRGLEETGYHDCMVDQEFARSGEPIRIACETDRIYLRHDGDVVIEDEDLGRRIRVRATGAQSTVVWNPWTEKSRVMQDFGNDDYRTMVCVESGNIGEKAVTLRPGKSAVLEVEYLTEAL